MKAARDAYGEALKELAKKERVVVLDADLSGSTKTSEFKKVCPERFFNMGIAEQNMMGTAAGLAASGKIPFASTFAVFATGRAYEIIRNSICYPNLNVKVVATHAGLTVGEDGASHQMLEDISLMRGLPNMTVISPADYNETITAIKAVAEMEGPVYVRLGRSKVPVVTDGKFEIGKATTLKEGNDITIAATGVMVSRALGAHDILKEKGISARVINFSTIKPIDTGAIIKAAKETRGIITAEEHNIIGGLGSAVAEVLSENYPTRLKRIGVKDSFGRSGDGFELLDYYGLGVKDIVEAAMEWGN
ncbi:MAG: transketolase family protein [Tissierellia bacterium]|nr:transketolase family protein [Tissierellia bacterium]